MIEFCNEQMNRHTRINKDDENAHHLRLEKEGKEELH